MRDKPKKITERDVEQLNQSLPHSDPTAEQLQTPTYQGTIEEIEERHGPLWLRRRRRDQRLGRR